MSKDRTPVETVRHLGIAAGVKLPGLGDFYTRGKYEARLAEMAGEGVATAEIPGAAQPGRRASVGGAVAGDLIAGPVGALISAGRGKRGKTTVIVRDGHGGLRTTEVKDAERAYRFVELFNVLSAQAAQDGAS